MPKLLDLFCGAGGAGMGYYLAGFDVTGVDIAPQHNYPFAFHEADAFEFARKYGKDFDLIHASPPCQHYSRTSSITGNKDNHPDLIDDVRDMLQEIDRPYVIENVTRAPLINPLMLCGTMFGLMLIRHRIFETSPVIWFPPATCSHRFKSVALGRSPIRGKHYHSVVGNFKDKQYAAECMGIDWMTKRKELREAIPPAYTQYIGEKMLELIS